MVQMLKQSPEQERYGEQVKAWEKQLYDNAGFLKYAWRFGKPIRYFLEPLACRLETLAAELRAAVEEMD